MRVATWVHNQPVIPIERVWDRGMSTCEQMDARFEKYNTTFHATRAFVRKSGMCAVRDEVKDVNVAS